MSTGMDWERIRDAYVQRFGSLLEAEAVKTFDRESSEEDLRSGHYDPIPQTLRFFMLRLGNTEQPAGPVTYASFGATCGGAGNELFLTAAARYAPFSRALEELAVKVPGDLRPLGLVRYGMRLTLFDSMLVVPVSDGTFLLGEVEGAARYALRLVPVTPAERQLAARDPERLLGLLRAAGALVADPLRACVVEPDRDGGRRANTVALLDEYRRKVRVWTERHQYLTAMQAPEVIIRTQAGFVDEARATLAYLEARAPAILPEPDAPELLDDDALTARFRDVFHARVGFSFEPFAPLAPPRVAQLFRVFLFLALTTHPIVQPIVHEVVMGPGRQPAQAREDDKLEAVVLGESVAEHLVQAFPSANVKRLEARAAEAFAEARRTFAAGVELPWRLHAWTAVVPTLCMTAADLGPAQGPAAEHALREAAELLAHADEEPMLGSGPAPTRLARIVSAVARDLFRSYQRAARRTLRERAARP